MTGVSFILRVSEEGVPKTGKEGRALQRPRSSCTASSSRSTTHAGWGGLTLGGSDEGFPKTSDEDEGVLKNSFRSDGGGEQSGGGARKTACYFDGVLVSLCSHIYFRSVQMVSLFWGSFCSSHIYVRSVQMVSLFGGVVGLCVCLFHWKSNFGC